jgi:hypothetical protein
MAVKRLLRQTLSHDDEMIEVHSLAELILSEGVRLAAGSSIKTDGEESDPWGLVGVVDIAKHRVSPLSSTSVNQPFHFPLFLRQSYRHVIVMCSPIRLIQGGDGAGGKTRILNSRRE